MLYFKLITAVELMYASSRLLVTKVKCDRVKMIVKVIYVSCNERKDGVKDTIWSELKRAV